MANTTGKKHGGRQAGTPNKTTEEMRACISSFIEKNWKTTQLNYNKMDPKDKLAFFEKLMKYVVPSLSTVAATVDFNQFSDDDLDKIINQLKSGSTGG